MEALDSRGLKWTNLMPIGVGYRDDDNYEPPVCPVCLWVGVGIGTATVDEAKNAADWTTESVLEQAGFGDVPIVVHEMAPPWGSHAAAAAYMQK